MEILREFEALKRRGVDYLEALEATIRKAEKAKVKEEKAFESLKKEKESIETFIDGFQEKEKSVFLGMVDLDFSEVPKVLLNKGLNRLYLNECHISKKTLKAFQKANCIEDYRLESWYKFNFPKEILSPKVRNIDLSFNYIEEIPKEIEACKSLEFLCLLCNNLDSLPKEFSNLKKLKRLDLRQNIFKEFPKEILKIESLEELDLTYTKIELLPKEIAKLKNLKSLNFSFWVKTDKEGREKVKQAKSRLKELKNLKEKNIYYVKGKE